MKEKAATPKGTPPPRPMRCAVYTRKSTTQGLDQEFSSLDAQREAGEAYIQTQKHAGWQLLPEHYDDGGFSGASIERPALQRLLADVDAGRIDVVIVYKVDRLSRSLLDFARLMERFEKHNAAFVSVTQQFNTAQSMGRLILNVLLSFAQFEREMIAERTRDKMGAARRKGKWVGGMPAIGYDVATAGRKLVINPTEAEQVRAMFDLYLQEESLLRVVETIHSRGWRTKSWTTKKGERHEGNPWGKGSVRNVLTNVTTSARSTTRARSSRASTSPSSKRRPSPRSATCWRWGSASRRAHATLTGTCCEAWSAAPSATRSCRRRPATLAGRRTATTSAAR